MGANSQYQATSPGLLIKEKLKERKISQRDFAKLAGVTPSHLSDLLSGRRRVTISFAGEVEKWLGISAKLLVEQQTAYDILKSEDGGNNLEEAQAEVQIDTFDRFVNVGALMRFAKKKCKKASEKLAALKEAFNLTDNTKKEFDLIADGCFRKSAKNGLDERMIATWVVMAKSATEGVKPKGIFSLTSRREVCEEVRNILHRNEGHTLTDLTNVLDKHGIVFKRVEKVDRASIDGFSYYSDPQTPCIVVTCRYDRIDNLAFTVMHELGHIYLKHTSPDSSCINIDTRSVNEEVDLQTEKKEKAADEFASDVLIPTSYWNAAPYVPLDPYKIKPIFEEWAKRLNLNKWIVLGQVSHMTGMYKFPTDETRKISGGKEVRVERVNC